MKLYETRNVTLAAAIVLDTQQQPAFRFKDKEPTMFIFEETDEILDIVERFYNQELTANLYKISRVSYSLLNATKAARNDDLLFDKEARNGK